MGFHTCLFSLVHVGLAHVVSSMTRAARGSEQRPTSTTQKHRRNEFVILPSIRLPAETAAPRCKKTKIQEVIAGLSRLLECNGRGLGCVVIKLPLQDGRAYRTGWNMQCRMHDAGCCAAGAGIRAFIRLLSVCTPYSAYNPISDCQGRNRSGPLRHAAFGDETHHVISDDLLPP